MKEFIKRMLSSMCGTLLAFGIIIAAIGALMMLAVSSLIYMTATAEKEFEPEQSSILHIKLQDQISDQRSVRPNFSNFKIEQKMSLYDIVQKIKIAKEDELITGIYLDINSLYAGLATIEEIRTALLDFKSTGKFIVAHADSYSHSSYYLATAADKIYLTPEGGIEFTGVSSSVMFFKSMFDKLGVEPIIIRHGKFKSAVEPFMQDTISEANKEQTQKYVNSLWKTMLSGIAEQRNVPAATLNQLADSLAISNSESAVTHKLIDGLKYKDQVFDELATLSDNDELCLVPFNQYHIMPELSGAFYSDKIAVIYATGSIVSGQSTENTIGSESLSEMIRSARNNDSVKAIVLRVNSPGGSALASEVIWRETMLAKEVKPLIVSFGDIAASGGYYIACGADTIVAQPNTITGSIGVFGVLFNTQLLMSNMGMNTDTVTSNKYSDLANPTRKITAVERMMMQRGVEDVYNTFVKHVAQGRDTTVGEIDKIAQGRVWTGSDARNIGLVDQLGGLDDCIKLAAEKADIDDYQVISYPQQNKYKALFSDMFSNVKTSVIKEELSAGYHLYEKVKEVQSMKGVQVRLPYFIDIQ